MYEEIIEKIKKQLAESKKTTANQNEIIEDILNNNRQMIRKIQRRK